MLGMDFPIEELKRLSKLLHETEALDIKGDALLEAANSIVKFVCVKEIRNFNN